MVEYRSIPSGTIDGWWSNYWSMVPTQTPINQYKNIDEGMSSKNAFDYWRGLTLPTATRGHVLFPTGAPEDVNTAPEVWFHIYVKGIKVADDPGLRFIIFYERIDVPSAAAGTNATNVYTIDGSLGDVTDGAQVYNYTRDQYDQVLTLLPPNRVVLQFGITGQTVGDHIDFLNKQAQETFDVNTSGLWKSYVCKIIVPNLTAEFADDMWVFSQTQTGGGIPPEEWE